MATSASTTQLTDRLWKAIYSSAFAMILRYALLLATDRTKLKMAVRGLERQRDGLRAAVVERNQQRARLEREVNELRGLRDQLHAVLQILRDRADEPWVKAFAQMALDGELYDDPLALEEEAERAAKRQKDEDERQVPLQFRNPGPLVLEGEAAERAAEILKRRGKVVYSAADFRAVPGKQGVYYCPGCNASADDHSLPSKGCPCDRFGSGSGSLSALGVISYLQAS